MKKFLSVIICITIILSMITSVYAYNIGDVINYTMYTDIVASINDYDIASFNIDGYTAVVAEDLRNYGFNVEWVPEQKALYISRNYSVNKVVSTYRAPQISASQVGTKADNVLYTDIVTYINGVQIPSFNIGGRTIIYFNDLASFGQISYNNDIRKISLSINDLPSRTNETYSGTKIPTYTSVTGVYTSDTKMPYIYSYSDNSEIDMYIAKLKSKGFSLEKVSHSGLDKTMFYAKWEGYKLATVMIVVREASREVAIMATDNT